MPVIQKTRPWKGRIFARGTTLVGETKFWWSWRGLNPRPLPCQGSALPLRHSPPFCYPLYSRYRRHTAVVFSLYPASPERVQKFGLPALSTAGSLLKHPFLLLSIIEYIYSILNTSYIILRPAKVVNSPFVTPRKPESKEALVISYAL